MQPNLVIILLERSRGINGSVAGGPHLRMICWTYPQFLRDLAPVRIRPEPCLRERLCLFYLVYPLPLLSRSRIERTSPVFTESTYSRLVVSVVELGIQNSNAVSRYPILDTYRNTRTVPTSAMQVAPWRGVGPHL